MLVIWSLLVQISEKDVHILNLIGGINHGKLFYITCNRLMGNWGTGSHPLIFHFFLNMLILSLKNSFACMRCSYMDTVYYFKHVNLNFRLQSLHFLSKALEIKLYGTRKVCTGMMNHMSPVLVFG